jgi:hypothetical protein
VIIPTKIDVIDFKVPKEASKNLNDYYYVVEVLHRGVNKTVTKSLVELLRFFDEIETQFVVQSEDKVSRYVEENIDRLDEVIRGEMQGLIQEAFENLTRIPFINNSMAFRDFFEL